MNLLLIGINHTTAPLKVREQFSFTEKRIKQILQELRKKNSLKELLILSTCNRMEIYAHTTNNKSGLKGIKNFLIAFYQLQNSGIKKYFYSFEDKEAVKHLLQVAGGLNSQVLGDTQILSQIKSAWGVAWETGTTGKLIDRVFQMALRAGKLVRSSTRISQGNVSIGSVALKMIEEQLGKLAGMTILIIGAGSNAFLISKYLKKKEISEIFVANRTYEKAKQLAQNCGGKAIPFDELNRALKRVDVVISSTASPRIILKKKTLEGIMQAREKPLLIMDIALPRDVDPAARNIPNLFLYDIDDLKSVVEENYFKRKQEVKIAEKLLQKELRKFSNEDRNP